MDNVFQNETDFPVQNTFNEDDMRIEGVVENDADENE